MLWISDENLQLPLYSTNVTPNCILNIYSYIHKSVQLSSQQGNFALQYSEANTEKHS